MSTEDTEGSRRSTEESREFWVRAAVLGDLERVLEIERGAATAPHWGEAEYPRIVRGEGVVRRCLLVADAGEVVGFAVGKVAGELGELESVAVLEETRGRGVGGALCRAVVGWCKDAGVEAVELEVRAGSSGAIRLYEGLGFVEVGRRVRYYEGPVEDAVLMRVELG
jgi:[ribosomal protein S18]-alanine N-acetyltransferase